MGRVGGASYEWSNPAHTTSALRPTELEANLLKI
jgi:hypothetical protein